MTVKSLLKAGFLCVGVIPCANTRGALTPYVTDLSGNSVDWAAGAAAIGAVRTIDWNTHPVGPLIPDFYSQSYGVTLLPQNGFSEVLPFTGVGGAVLDPTSTGEGQGDGSRALFDGATASSLTFDFDVPVGAFGLKTIDLFNPNGVHRYSLAFYSGSHATGSLLGTVVTADYCFQQNYVYFLGVVSDHFDISSVVLSDQDATSTLDGVGFDDVQFVVVPDPSALAAPSLFFPCLLGRPKRKTKI